jgi:hypothetical protein
LVGPTEPYFESAAIFKNPSYREIDSAIVGAASAGNRKLVHPAWYRVDANFVWRSV